jgi:hypothetical protein
MIEQSQVTLEQAQELMEEMSAVNLDEVSPGTVSIAFREFVAGKNGSLRYSIEATTKEINTWVPMFLFNRMLSNQKKLQKHRRALARQVEFAATTEDVQEPDTYDVLAEEPDLDLTALTDQAFRAVLSESEPALVWQAKEVLTIWKLTPGEEQMSLKRLVLGLTFEQITGLFTRFFGALLRQKQSKV